VAIRNVELGVSDDEKQQIVAGLQLGEQVVIDGVDRLRDGARIRRPGSTPRSATDRPVAVAPADARKAPPQVGQSERQRRREANGADPVRPAQASP
jgi:multidrug efflux system membrane fusion protein